MSKGIQVWSNIIVGVASAAILTVSGMMAQAKTLTPSLQLNIRDRQQFALLPFEREGKLDSNSNVLVDDNSYYDLYSFEGEAGESVIIELISTEFDAYLLLLDPEGQKVAEDDDSAGGSNARILVKLPITGTYQVLVNTYERGQTGSYRISWRETTESDTVAAEETDTSSENTEADQIFQEGLELFQEGSAEALRQALIKWEQAATLFRQMGDNRGEAISLLGVGRIYSDLGDNQQALEYYQRTLPLYQATGDRTGEAATLNNIGIIYDDLGEKQQALAYYQRALLLHEATGDRSSIATTFNNIGKVYSDLGDNQQALAYYQRALPLYQATSDRAGIATTFNNLGMVYNDLGEKQQALAYYQRALPLQEAIGDRAGIATTLNNIGKVYNSLGEKDGALAYFQRALPLRQAIGDRAGEARTLNNIGAVYNSLEEKQQALAYYQRALPLYQAVGDRAGVAVILNNIGRVYSDLGDEQQALVYYQRALPLRQAVGDRTGEARTLNNIGAVYSDLGDEQQALAYYQRALPIRQAVGDRTGEATTLSNIGKVYFDLGDDRQALAYYQRALPLHQATGDRAGEATTLNNIGSVYNALGDEQQALAYYQRALPIRQAVGDRSGVANSLSSIALTQRSQGNLETALAQMEKAIAILEDLRTKAPTTELRQTYFASVQGYYEVYIDLLMELHRQNPNKGYDARAFQASESSRARTLTEILTEAQFDLKADLPPALLAEEKRLNQALSTAEQERVQLLKRSYSNDELAAITNAIEQTLQDLQNLEVRIRRENPAYANLKYPKPLTLQQIQGQILDADTLLLEYALGEERSYLFAVSKDSFTAYELPSRQEIETATERYITALQAEDRNPLAEGTELAQMLLDPVADKLKNQRLAIVADGKLNRLPFGALPWGASGAEGAGASIAPLLVNHEIINLSSASSLEAQRSQWAKRTPAPKAIAVLADPVFSPRDPRLSGDTLPSTAENPLLGLLQRGCNSFDRLPNTQREAENILKLVPDDQEFLALGFAANRTQATNGNLSQYQILHLATHGCIQDDPLRSGLVLSLYDEQGKSQDGLLRLQDIYNLDLNAELVVLSACQTGIGEEVNGEGVVGLTRGFMYAGAKRVVVSLWNVNDAATANLMTDYYQQMLGSGLNSISALRQAQLKMWREGELPYKWAAFTIQGDWQ